ncbi:MAG: threonine--tRNA ligase [Bacillota bacterium]
MANNERYLIFAPSGVEYPVDSDRSIGSPAFWSMAEKEALKRDYAPLADEPVYLEICRKLGISWEEMSDSGHMRYGPKGALVFDLLADYVNEVVRDLELPFFQVRGTNMFSLDEGPVAQHAALFGDRLYAVKDPDSGRQHVLRYAACHQQFAMIKHWQISYRHLPFAAFELADSYRMEQSGECMLAFRTRRLNMPDLHVFAKDQPEAAAWFMRLHQRIMDEVHRFGDHYELLVNLSSDQAYQSNRALLQGLAEALGKPLLIHIYPGDRDYYWTVNAEYHIIDVMGRAREIGTVQIDVGNAERFGISYVDSDGSRQYPIILHSAVIGTIERFLYLILNRAASDMVAGRVGQLPYWLAPEQIRLLPVNSDHVARSRALAAALNKRGIRAGIDDRPEKVGKKVRDAHGDWVPALIVIGEQEVKQGVYRLVKRRDQSELLCSEGELVDLLRQDQCDYPWRPLYFPAQMSLRPVF